MAASTLSKEDKQYIALAAIIGVIAIGLFIMFWYKPQAERLNRLNVQKEDLQKTVDEEASYVEGPESHAKVIDLQNRIAKFEQRLPNEKEIPELLTFLKDAADKSDVEYVSIVAQPLAPSEFYIEIPFNVVLKGKYHNVGQVINQIENHERLMKVDNVDIIAGREKTFKHNVSFKLSTYVFNPNPSQTTNAVPGKK